MADTDGDDITGDEANVLGAIFRRARRGRPAPRRIGAPQLAQRATWKDSRLRSFAGIGPSTWAIADATDKVTTIEPQESFEGRRLIIDTAAVGVTNSVVGLIRRVEVGTMPQSPSVEQPAPMAMFRADATYSYLDLQIAYRATKLTVTEGVSAAPVGAAFTAVGGFFGNWIR